MSLSAELEHGAPEQVKLDSHLSAHGRINDCELVSSENLQRVVDEVQDRYESCVADGLQPLQGQLSLLLQTHVVPWLEQILLEELSELVPHLDVVVVKQVLESSDVEVWLGPRGSDGRELLLVGSLHQEMFALSHSSSSRRGLGRLGLVSRDNPGSLKRRPMTS